MSAFLRPNNSGRISSSLIGESEPRGVELRRIIQRCDSQDVLRALDEGCTFTRTCRRRAPSVTGIAYLTGTLIKGLCA